MTTTKKPTLKQQVQLLLGNIDALETEIMLLESENTILAERVEELEKVLSEKVQTV
jgi:hypothetical protein